MDSEVLASYCVDEDKTNYEVDYNCCNKTRIDRQYYIQYERYSQSCCTPAENFDPGVNLVGKDSSDYTAYSLKEISCAAECGTCCCGESVVVNSICVDISNEAINTVCAEDDAYEEPYAREQDI